MQRFTSMASLLCLASLLGLGCASDGGTDGGSGGSESGSETSDSDSSTETGTAEGGDGDGDPATGDGDGDATGDGDGDPTGDGDGDPTGDGDGDPTGDGDGDAGGDLSCPLVNACVVECAGDMACTDACLAAAMPDALDDAEALLLCATANDCQDQSCVEDNCPAELLECFTGDGSCLEYATCVEDCAEDEVCITNCTAEASPLAQGQLESLQECAVDNACEDEDCLLVNCGLDYLACVGGGADGLACTVLAQCVFDCGDDELCALACDPPLDAEAEAEAAALLECAENSMCEDFDCSEEQCPDQWGACIAGDANCSELAQCLGECQDVEICEANCFASATIPAQIAAFELSECIEDNNCVDPQCIVDNCALFVDACDGD